MVTIRLYLKTHKKTGKKYFGVTTRDDYHRYDGSGKHWLRHLRKHGKEHTTVIVAEFKDQALATEFALEYSAQHQIVESKEYANMCPEDARQGAYGNRHTDEQKKKWSLERSGVALEKPHSCPHCKKNFSTQKIEHHKKCCRLNPESHNYKLCECCGKNPVTSRTKRTCSAECGTNLYRRNRHGVKV
jgi:hypothetical protein